MDRRSLETKLDYQFRNADLLRRALTHASAAEARKHTATYQRLEFLGDRVLGLVVAELVYLKHPSADEGELSQRLTLLVRKEACANRAEALGLGSQLILGGGEAQSGGRAKPALLADVMESVIGAIYLDAGFSVAKQIIKRIWQPLLDQDPESLRDPKTALQEWAHARGLDNPKYAITGREGPDHQPTFTVTVHVSDEFQASGRGASKREAEQHAADAMLQSQESDLNDGA